MTNEKVNYQNRKPRLDKIHQIVIRKMEKSGKTKESSKPKLDKISKKDSQIKS